jgi:hypothetical protein
VTPKYYHHDMRCQIDDSLFDQPPAPEAAPAPLPSPSVAISDPLATTGPKPAAPPGRFAYDTLTADPVSAGACAADLLGRLGLPTLACMAGLHTHHPSNKPCCAPVNMICVG